LAERYATEAVKGGQRSRARETEAYGLRVLGLIELKKGDRDRAEALLRRSLEIFRSVDHALETGRTLRELAAVLAAKGSQAEAGKLAAEARAILTAIGAKLDLQRLDKDLPAKVG
jgi:Tfp pilus assembly protein PilF